MENARLIDENPARHESDAEATLRELKTAQANLDPGGGEDEHRSAN